MEWQSIETAPKGLHILFFPEVKNPKGNAGLASMIRTDYFPVVYPRQPTHWMPLPKAPE